MAIRDDFTAGEVLAAADLNDTFASKPPFAYGTATPSTTVEGFIFYDENVTPPAPKFWDGSAFQSFGGGKILQIVRATDVTQRTTTSTSYVDVTGMSVTITPQKSTSAVLIIANYIGTSPNAGSVLEVAVTDSSNNVISAAESARLGGNVADSTSAMQTVIAYATPATTSATTFKMRFRVNNAGTVQIRNDVNTGQIYAIEVSA